MNNDLSIKDWGVILSNVDVLYTNEEYFFVRA